MNAIKEKVDRYLLDHADRWKQLGHELLELPETGFHELETSARVKSWFERLCAGEVKNEAVTGQRLRLKGGESRVHLALMGELDAIYCPSHPHANPSTGMAHACGHNVQITALLAVAEALSATGVMGELAGDVTFMAVPCEEPLPAQLIDELVEAGKIASDSGKKELMRLGVLEDVDLALATHAYVNDDAHPEKILVNTSCNGLVNMSFVFRGASAHSTVCPEKGINALNAAVLAINNMQALRENFDPSEYIRLSYCLTEGGESTGAIPEKAKLEVVLATKTVAAMEALKGKVIVAAECGARVIGCTVEASEDVCLLPYAVDENLMEAVKKASVAFIGEEAVAREHNYFSNDLGDVSQRMPTAQVVFGGFSGSFHTKAFTAVDDDKAYVLPARCMAAVLIDLLSNDAEKALAVKNGFGC